MQLVSLLIGSLCLVVAGISLIVLDEFAVTTYSALFVGIACLTNSYWQFIGVRDPLRDERARRIGTRAATYSWFVTLFVTCVGAALLNFTSGYTGFWPSGYQAIGAVIIMLVLTMLCFNLYYEYVRGDVE